MVEICGHHVFNIIWAYGMGRDHLGDETNDFRKIFHKVMDDPSEEVKVIVGVDDVCGQCQDNVDGKCQSYDGTIADRKAITKLGIKAGDVMKWADLVNLVAESVKNDDDFLEIFSPDTLKGRYAYFKEGIKKLSTNPGDD